METIKINTYKFEELSKEAQEKVIEKMYDINLQHEWFDFIIEDFKQREDIVKYFEVEKVYFSGFCSQGDGAMFEYSHITELLMDEAIDNLKIKYRLAQFKINAMKQAKDFSGSGTHSGHYYHEKSVSHIIEISAYPYEERQNIDELFALYHEDLEEFIIDKYEGIARDLYRDLEKEHDYFTSGEAIKETIIANEYDFLIDGSRSLYI